MSKEVEKDEENTSDLSPFSDVLSSDYFLDECPALLSQVPDSFDLGRTRVRLNSIAASARHIAIGSECGALFLFNRRIGQSVKPLRTDHCEVISAMEFCPDRKDGTELLAIGHHSGKLVILSLPCADAANPKLLQHVQDQAHRHSAVRCLCWSFDGRMLFSGDEFGMVLVTHVDFTNEHFPLGVVESGGVGGEGPPIVQMLSSGPLFAFAKGKNCKVFNWQKDNETVAEVTAQKQIVSIHLSSNAFDHLSLLQSDGTIWRKFFAEKDGKLFELGSISSDIFHGRQLRILSFSDCDGPSWALWTQNGHIEKCCLSAEGFAVDKLALEGHVDQVLSVCASSSASSSPSSSDELFLLSAPSLHPLQQRRRIFRLSRLSSAHPSLTICSPPPTNGHSLLFGYFYGTVGRAVGELGRLKDAAAGSDGIEKSKLLPKGSEELLGRLNRELDLFLMGDGAKEVDEVGGCKTANTLTDFLPEFGSVFPDGTTKIASGLHQMFGQFYQQSSNLFPSSAEDKTSQNEKATENDRLSVGGTSSRENICQRWERRDSPAKMSPPLTEFSCSVEGDEFAHLADQFANGKMEEEKGREKVRVERKRIVVRRKKLKNNGRRRRDREEEKEERKGKRRKPSLEEEKRHEERDDEDNATLTDWEQQRTTNWTAPEGVGTEGRDGRWTPGAVPDERQQQILEVLGIVPKPMASSENGSKEMLILQKLQNQPMKDDNELEEGPNESQMSKSVNEGTKDGEIDSEPLADLKVHNANGYSFPPANRGQFVEDEFPTIVPSVSLADLFALFPSSSVAHSSVSAALSPPPPPPFSSSPSVTFSSSASSSSSSFSVHPSPHYQSLLRLSPPDQCQWRRLDVPFTVSDLTLCRHYLIACPGHKRTTKSPSVEKQRPHYLMANLLGDKRAMDEWVPLRVNASAVAVNDEGTLLWRIYDGVAYSPCSPPDPICPSATLSRTTAWMEMSNQFEGDIVQIALNSQNAWFLADTGRTKKERTVWVQMFLPEMGIFHRAVDEDSRHFFTQLAVSDHAVWTLSGGFVVARVGLKLDLAPMGLDWADIDGQPRKFVSIVLHEHTGFGLERNGNVWFVHGVAENAPFGLVRLGSPVSPLSLWVCSPLGDPSLGLSPSSEWRLHVGAPGVFVVVGSVLLHTNSPLIGDYFGHVVPDRLALNDHFTLITASGFCGLANECLYLCQPASNELFSFSLRKRHFTSLPPYCSNSSAKVKCLSATHTHLFVLDNSGKLYVRPVGLQAEVNGGRIRRQWLRVVMPSEDTSSEMDRAFVGLSSPFSLVSVAVCSSSVWVVSDEGSVWASHSLHSNHSSPSEIDPNDGPIEMTWIKIEGPTPGKEADLQIRVSPSGNSVWLFSKSSGIGWFRTDLSERNRTGRRWTTSKTIQSIYIDELAVSDVSVWALANGTGQLHRLFPFGWQPMDVRLKALSVDAFEGRLWALDNEFRIVRHEMAVVSHPPFGVSSDRSELENNENLMPWQPKAHTTLRTKGHLQTFSSDVAGNISAESVRWAFNFKRMFSFFR
ncbi:hypothetical protein niasHT_035171 [Heterodera trifolii]|uniref:Uncharacterized protein n=1 Tax=Heterodera trifolii TaxID=157864 RepID=A0ABD2J3P7_9BILA